MMLIYDSFRAVFDCFSANNDRRVAKISTPTNFDIVALIFMFSNWYCHSVYIFSSIWRHNGALPDQLWSGARSQSSKYHTLPSWTALSEKNLVSHDGYRKSLFWASATRLLYNSLKSLFIIEKIFYKLWQDGDCMYTIFIAVSWSKVYSPRTVYRHPEVSCELFWTVAS